MTINRLFLKAIALLLVIALASCDESNSPDRRVFDNDLRGTWVSNDPSIYSGTLIIGYDHIKIEGYNESQTPLQGDESKLPFRGFTKGAVLSGYSEGGFIYINDIGMWQNGIPFTYYTDNSGRNKFLRFTFGDRYEEIGRAHV